MADTTPGERLQNVLAKRGVASRRGSAQLIQEGKVTVNGELVTEPGARVEPTDRINVRGRPLPMQEEKKRTFLFYKPIDVVCSTNGQGAISVCNFFKQYRERLVPVGRLDKESEGLLLMSNDGTLINYMTHPRYDHEKEYEVTVDGPWDQRVLAALQEPMEIDGYTIRPVKVEVIKSSRYRQVLRFFLKEGRNRQIRKMCEQVELDVIRLKRVRLGQLTIGTLRAGTFRELTDVEVKALMS